MSRLNISIPDSIRDRLEHFAQEDGVSVDDYVAAVVSQRMAVADADSYVQSRAAKGNAGRLIELLDKAPATDPEPHDRISKNGESGPGE